MILRSRDQATAVGVKLLFPEVLRTYYTVITETKHTECAAQQAVVHL